MGNYMSCALAKLPAGHGHGHGGGGGGCKCARVTLPDSSVKQVTLPATAADVMMDDAPGHFLVDARGGAGGGRLGVGARLAALPADQELELGAAYATFPMKRRGTPLTAADVARLAAAAEPARDRESRRWSSAKVANAAVVVPAASAAEAVAAAGDDAPCKLLRLEEMVDDAGAAAAAEIGEMMHRASNARSRRPTLETIEEESYMSSRCIAC